MEGIQDKNSPISLFGSRQLSSLKLVVTSKPSINIPYSVILPFREESDTFTFLIDSLNDFNVQFDIYPVFGSKVIGRAVIVSSQLQKIAAQGPHLKDGLNDECICPLMDTHLRIVGEVKFALSIIRPFDHPSLEIGGKVETYWKSTMVNNDRFLFFFYFY